jgi:hypothetical protein
MLHPPDKGPVCQSSPRLTPLEAGKSRMNRQAALRRGGANEPAADPAGAADHRPDLHKPTRRPPVIRREPKRRQLRSASRGVEPSLLNLRRALFARIAHQMCSAAIAALDCSDYRPKRAPRNDAITPSLASLPVCSCACPRQGLPADGSTLFWPA